MANEPADPRKPGVNTRQEVERRDLPVNQTITLPSAQKPAEPPRQKKPGSKRGGSSTDRREENWTWENLDDHIIRS